MMKQFMNNLFIAAMLLFSSLTYADPGLLFNITESGVAASVDVILCLNGKGPLSCQNYHVSAQNLAISTTARHQYPAAGIKVLTPGYKATGCTPYSNGYCLFAVNSQTPTPILLNGNTPSKHTIGGMISGLVGLVSLQNNGGDTLTRNSDGSFTFTTPVAQGASYNVTVSTQPTMQTCTVSNGTGTMGSSNVTSVQVDCVSNTTTLSVDTTGTIPVNSGPGSITITNTGTDYAATNVSVTLPSAWTTDVIQNASNCTSIPPNNGTCTISFTTATPYVAQGNIPVTGDNISNTPTTALAFTVDGYLVWEVTDSSTVQVIDTSDLSSSPEQWGNSVTTHAQSLTDGFLNTSTIDSTGGIGISAAVSCYNSTNGGASAGSWYLPAICQIGGSGQDAGCSSGLANIDTNLVQLGFGNFDGFYWSSTEISGPPQQVIAWTQYFVSGGGSLQANVGKSAQLGVRCARGLTY